MVEVFDEADNMCPNCVTPWKCNGPHLSWLTEAAKRHPELYQPGFLIEYEDVNQWVAIPDLKWDEVPDYPPVGIDDDVELGAVPEY